MSRRHSTARPFPPPAAPESADHPAPRPSRPPLPAPDTARSYGKVTGGKGGKPLPPKTFSHRKRG